MEQYEEAIIKMANKINDLERKLNRMDEVLYEMLKKNSAAEREHDYSEAAHAN